MQLCTEACAQYGENHPTSCQFFLYSTDVASGSCWIEFTASEDCPEGWRENSYDFYRFEPAESDLAFEYAGCFRDNEGGRDLNGIDEPLDIAGGSTPLENANSCLALCAGYSYFGLQWTNECFCDNSYNNGYGTNGDQADCPGGECPITDCDADGVLDADGTADLCGNGVANCGDRNAVYCIGAC